MSEEREIIEPKKTVLMDLERLKGIADNILRQVVCDCGNYRHHGVDWMPEGSGEGLSVTLSLILQAYSIGYIESLINVERENQ